MHTPPDYGLVKQVHNERLESARLHRLAASARNSGRTRRANARRWYRLR